MTFSDVQEPVQLEIKIKMIVHKCVQLRKDNNESIVELSKWLQIDRRKITSFENSKFDLLLAEKILNWYGKSLYLNIIN